MLRTTALTTGVLLGLALLAPTSASAAGETCRGEAATLVGSPRTSDLRGTEGRDVIVTNGAGATHALGGNDLICVTGYGAAVFAGDGDDVVDGSTLTGSGAQARLGAGRDQFLGSPGFDVVHAGTPASTTLDHEDTDADVIDMGPASSARFISDSVTTGQPGEPNSDVIRMGRGGVSWAGIPTAETVLEGGTGSSLGLRAAASESIALDNVTGTLVVDEQPALRFSGFDSFYVLAADGPRAFSFRGSDRDESLGLEFWDGARHSARMGGGDDRLHFYSYGRNTATAGTSYDGGAGTDLLELTLPEEVDLDLDLARGRLSTGPRRTETTVKARRFEDAAVMARDVEIVGTGGPNALSVYACRSRVQGRAGGDRLTTFASVMDESLPCRWPRATFVGGGGDDVLVGSRGPDRLLGGRGRDVAKGTSGRDVCSAERTRSCEIRR